MTSSSPLLKRQSSLGLLPALNSLNLITPNNRQFLLRRCLFRPSQISYTSLSPLPLQIPYTPTSTSTRVRIQCRSRRTPKSEIRANRQLKKIYQLPKLVESSVSFRVGLVSFISRNRESQHKKNHPKIILATCYKHHKEQKKSVEIKICEIKEFLKSIVEIDQNLRSTIVKLIKRRGSSIRRLEKGLQKGGDGLSHVVKNGNEQRGGASVEFIIKNESNVSKIDSSCEKKHPIMGCESIKKKASGMKDVGGTNISDESNQQEESGVESLLEKLTMEDKNGKPTSIKGIENSVLMVGSLSRCTRSATRSSGVVDTDKAETPSDSATVLEKLPFIKDATNDGKSEKGQKRKHRPNDGDYQQPKTIRYENLKTRTSPKTLYDTVVDLTNEKKKAVSDLGFGSMLNMTMDGITQKLAYYIVDSLNTTKMEISIETGPIPVTLNSIHELLGLLNCGEDITQVDDEFYGKELHITWKQQFKKGAIRPTDVMKMIESSNNVDLMFKIKNEEMLSKINWCKYLYDKVRTTKDVWNRGNNDCFYTGPITYLLLLYVDTTISPIITVTNTKRAIEVWSGVLLHSRETSEIRAGGFGLLPIKGSNPQYQKENTSSQPQSTPSLQQVYLSEQDYMIHMEQKMRALTHARSKAEGILETAMTKFPTSVCFQRFKLELMETFKTTPWSSNSTYQTPPKMKTKFGSGESEVNADEVCWDSPGFVTEAITSADRISAELEKRSALKRFKECGRSDKPPSFDLGISPEKEKVEVNNTDEPKRSPLLSKDIITMQKGKGASVPELSRPTHETRRNVGLGDHLRSPFVLRAASMQVTPEEKKMYEWALSNYGHKSDKLLEMVNGISITRAGIESLAAATPVYSCVVDAFATILNDEERMRNRDSPRRYFFHTSILGDLWLKCYLTDVTHMYKSFRRSLAKSVNNNKDIANMKSVDLVYFPIIKGEDFYVVVIDFKNPSITILDSDREPPRSEQLMLKHYGYAPKVLSSIHPEDSRVYTMRHMETFKGDLKNWKPGFCLNPTKMQAQIKDLRAKYVGKVLMSPLNKLSVEVKKQYTKFFIIPAEVRADLLEQARITRWERLNPYEAKFVNVDDKLLHFMADA
ncbi:hypothetical protein OSB04_020110 [Centaurea solstitialis]|uniref:Ubiquitin-like protease family profile domain-containing protein n=1 Tax=Centaurea solstitialis TaxID=347529 RepID=A0AA38W3J6_9ASTR|nr:hypothetical protein OSB04_020110 [Centaurea solstitialis]